MLSYFWHVKWSVLSHTKCSCLFAPKQYVKYSSACSVFVSSFINGSFFFNGDEDEIESPQTFFVKKYITVFN